MGKRFIGFVDGENLVRSYERMRKDRHSPREHVIHVPNEFVWHQSVTESSASKLQVHVSRINYYATTTSANNRMSALEKKIGESRYSTGGGEMLMAHSAHELIPHVFARTSRKGTPREKSKVVDIQITIDVMTAAMSTPIDGILLITGDGDFEALIRHITRHTSKQVVLASLSSGLAKRLRSIVEGFVDLDPIFFDD